jgi:indole-3-glycerol phosphate synthase
MSDLLPAMVAAARRAAEERARVTTASAVEREAQTRHPRAEAFRESLSTPGVRVIAECKRRSPSRGILRRQYEPAEIAREYDLAGAAALSVLTEPTFFDGSLDHLRAIRAVTRLPLLRKDFIVTRYQIAEARAAGADAILLIVATLDDATLRALIDTAREFALAPLVEVHDAADLARALDAGATTVGVNSRNLRTLHVNPQVLEDLIADIPEDTVAVAESGLKSGDDLRRLRSVGYDAFLIGERFMTQPSPGAALAELTAAARPAVEELR